MRRRMLNEVTGFAIPTEPLLLTMKGIDGWSGMYPVGNGVKIEMFADESCIEKSNWTSVQIYSSNLELINEIKWLQNKTITPEDGAYFKVAVSMGSSELMRCIRITWED